MSMNNLEIAIKEYLDSQNWRYKHDEEKRRFVLGMRLENEDVDGCTLVITARDEEDLSCKAIYEFNVPEKKRDLIVEYITRANYGLFLGGFQMDLDDGEVLYQTAGVYYDHRPMQQEVRRLIQVGIHMAERYGQGFYDVMYKGVTPEAAIAAAESDMGGGSAAPASASPSSSAAASSASSTPPASSEAVEGFRGLVAEMNEEQLGALMEAIRLELQAREEKRRREEEERRRAEEERRRREEEEAAKKSASSSLMDRFRRLIGGDDEKRK